MKSQPMFLYKQNQTNAMMYKLRICSICAWLLGLTPPNVDSLRWHVRMCPYEMFERFKHVKFWAHVQCVDSLELGLPHSQTHTLRPTQTQKRTSPRWPSPMLTTKTKAGPLAKAPVGIEQLKGHGADLCRKAMGKTIQTFLGQCRAVIASLSSFISSITKFQHRFPGSQPQFTTFPISGKSETSHVSETGMHPPSGSKWHDLCQERGFWNSTWTWRSPMEIPSGFIKHGNEQVLINEGFNRKIT